MSKLARPAFFLAGLFAFVMAVLPHPPQFSGDISDKLQHIIAFGTLAVLGALAFPSLSKLRLIGALGLYGATIELVQAVPALHRDSDIVDFAADMAAAIVAVVAVRWIVARYRV